jgi:quinol monooxygenase YgiN
MTAFNAVRFRVKPGRDRDFLDAHKNILKEWPGLRRASIFKTGEQTYCLVAEWTDMEALGKARPQMVATLNSFRAVLEDIGDGKGVTDAVSGAVVLDLK